MSNVVQLPTPQATAKEPDVPDFITRHDIEAMSDEKLDELINAIRSRRLRSVHVYKQTVAEKNAIEEEKIKVKIEKKCEQIIKKINTIDKQMEDFEKYINELRGLRIQAGMSVI